MTGLLTMRRVPIVTPEGIPLEFTVAPLGTRFIALLLDLLLLCTVLFLLSLLVLLAGTSPVLLAILTILAFLVMHFYFACFEIAWQGQTPGKRAVRIRVIDRFGGTLDGRAVFTRNIVRLADTFLPLAVLLQPTAVVPGAPEWVSLLGLVFLVLLGMLPVFTRQRLRAGDLLAGTFVVTAPRVQLLRDMGSDRKEEPAPRYAFTAEQLDYYGIYELHVLEELLRHPSPDSRSVRTVVQKICERIDYPQVVPAPERKRFLKDFYTAQRAALERKMLFGDRRERKRAEESEARRAGEVTRRSSRARPSRSPRARRGGRGR